MTGGEQAFCGAEDCDIFTWNPRKSREDIADEMSVIDLSDTPYVDQGDG
jgi:hypothetical protein